MDFTFSDEQEFVRRTARELLARECPPARVRAALETPEGFDPALWRRMAELGWLGFLVPEAQGGAGLDFVDLAPLLEELGRALAPTPFLGHLLGTLALLRAGGPEPQSRWLPSAARGDLTLALAVTEESGREEPAEIRLRAERSGAGWTLHGRKLFVPDAQSAGAIAVLARCGDDLAWLLAERAAPGVHVEPLRSIDPTRRLCALHFDGAPAALLGEPGGGWRAWEWIRDRALVALACDALGGAEAALEATVAYTRTRVQFGAPLAANQVIRHRCADLLIELEAARSLVHHAAWAAARESADAPLAAAMAKARACATYRRVAADSIQLHGSMGFTWELDCHLYYRRAEALEVALGDAAQQRERIAELLGGQPDPWLS